MGVFSRNRAFFLAGALLCAAQALFAGDPSGRTQARMVFDPTTSNVILFGGLTGFDKGSGRNYELNETWTWNGARWVQRYSKESPTGRAAFAMVWDSKRDRVVLFGGRNSPTTERDDTWFYQHGEWTEHFPDTAPHSRQLAGAAYDSARDRIVMFGGSSTIGTVVTPHYDTWEFDGMNWNQVIANGPTVLKPSLAYDPLRNEVVMIGINDRSETQMYVYDAAARSWTRKTPTALPPCGNEGSLLFDSTVRKLLYIGGVCTNSLLEEETWEWSGENWAKRTPLLTAIDRAQGQAVVFDGRRQQVFMFGGTTISSTEPRGEAYYLFAGDWLKTTDPFEPGARSLFGFRRDPLKNAVWLVCGLHDNDLWDDFWKYQFGQWTKIAAESAPTACLSPVTAFDTDRNRLVVVCGSVSETFEWDGDKWTSFSSLTTKPPGRRFASMTYDPTIKKTVFFGGHETDYRNDTWTWDGTTWTEVKKNRAPARALASMWYDPVLKKTVMFGGVGRPKPEDAIVRYDDMLTFDGTGWTALTTTATPGKRYGAQLVVDPRTNKAYLFGGLVLEQVDEETQRQVYANDTWEWNGTAWRKLETAGAPPARENGGFEFDPSTNQLVLFGGWAGHFLSDVWVLDRTSTDPERFTWRILTEPPTSRRRAGSQFARPTPPEPPPSTRPLAAQ